MTSPPARPRPSEPDEAARIAAKLAARYPPRRVPRPAVISGIGLLAAAFLCWLLWAAWLHANPVVSGAVPAFSFPSATEATVTLTVQRRDPAIPVVCRVIVQAVNFETVGQKDILVPPRPEKLTDVKDRIRTVRKGTSVSVKECRAR